jgi:hypothetical protein
VPILCRHAGQDGRDYLDGFYISLRCPGPEGSRGFINNYMVQSIKLKILTNPQTSLIIDNPFGRHQMIPHQLSLNMEPKSALVSPERVHDQNLSVEYPDGIRSALFAVLIGLFVPLPLPNPHFPK